MKHVNISRPYGLYNCAQAQIDGPVWRQLYAQFTNDLAKHIADEYGMQIKLAVRGWVDRRRSPRIKEQRIGE